MGKARGRGVLAFRGTSDMRIIEAKKEGGLFYKAEYQLLGILKYGTDSILIY
jgi:hypothetical protein